MRTKRRGGAGDTRRCREAAGAGAAQSGKHGRIAGETAVKDAQRALFRPKTRCFGGRFTPLPSGRTVSLSASFNPRNHGTPFPGRKRTAVYMSRE
ncbi:MAG: hypothetical protein LBL31_08145 [Spirochaetaceae bacterium]|nr:hypothetical protein [Spirochaetaceae bacterium]